MEAAFSKVGHIEQKIRSLINRPRLQSSLLLDRHIFARICCALDVLGDVEIALGDLLSANAEAGSGQAYLLVYGGLQALILQQDAVQELRDIFKLEFEQNSRLKEIRNIRNAVAARIFADYLARQVDEFNVIAREIDNEYENDPEKKVE